MSDTKDLLQPGAGSIDHDQALHQNVASELGPAYVAEDVAAGEALDAGVVGNLQNDVNALLGTETKFNVTSSKRFLDKLTDRIKKQNPDKDINQDQDLKQAA